ncbi:MAG: aldehyde dehydrogenase [Alphaproteobacteria bacterium]|nr:MAG: aldehyde dehydrogenase [Alphaproteobacteria bacterium]
MFSLRSDGYPLHRRDVVARLLRGRGSALVVAGLGAPAWDVTAAGDSPFNFPLWGAMGGAALVGLGLALAQPARRVLVVTGDGEMLMGLGGLATIGLVRPGNLAIVVLDNERYGETGMQPTHTAANADLAAMAIGAGIANAFAVFDEAELEAAVPRILSEPGPLFVTIKVQAEELPLVLPPKDGAYLKDRFRTALLGPDAAV